MTTTNDKTPASNLRKGGGSPPSRRTSEIVVLDYDGTVGRATLDKQAISDQQAVPHTLSPRIFFLPLNGTPDLNLQPGLNLVPRDLWKTYTETVCDGNEGLPQLMRLIETDQITDLEGKLPTKAKDVLDLISRSMSHEGIEWIIRKEQEGSNRPEVIKAAQDRLARSHPVQLRPMTYQGRVPNVRPSGETTSMGM